MVVVGARDLAVARRTVAGCAAKSQDRTAMASIYSGACRLVSLRNSKGTARMSAFAARTPRADRIDYWSRRRVLQYWDGVHPSQGLLNSGRDRRVELSAIRHDRHRDGIGAP